MVDVTKLYFEKEKRRKREQTSEKSKKENQKTKKQKTRRVSPNVRRETGQFGRKVGRTLSQEEKVKLHTEGYVIFNLRRHMEHEVFESFGSIAHRVAADSPRLIFNKTEERGVC
jgi:hypothetical protein